MNLADRLIWFGPIWLTKLQLRNAGFNILNGPNFALPHLILVAAAGGSIISAITTSRQVHMVAKVET